MERSEKQAGWLKKLNRRMQGTGDSEPEQAKLRSSIAVILVTYICFPWHADETLAQTITSHASIVLLSWTMLGFGPHGLPVGLALVYAMLAIGVTRRQLSQARIPGPG